MKPKLLTLQEVADLFRVSKPTIYRMVESRILPFYRIVGSLRFNEDEMLSYLEGQRVMPMEERFLVAPHKSHPKNGG
jgi:excisionase family DNA binding protein